MALQWSDARFATGFEDIDAQHRRMFDMANELLAAATGGRPDAEVESMLDALGTFAGEHFICEEGLMERHRCSACIANKVAHEWFLADYRELRAQFDRDGVTPDLAQAIEKNVCQWLEAHLLAIDLTLRESEA